MKSFAAFFAVVGMTVAVSAQNSDSRPELIYHPRGNFSNNIARPLRYWPINGDFVITNGTEFFNRPLYCMNSAFRVDGGDKPEFSLYLPGRGGNLRLGIKTQSGVKWLNDADQIIARYRAGSMIYEIHDPLLGDGLLELWALPLSETKGFIVAAKVSGWQNPVELVWAFGGVNGMRGSRNGDIGCERVPVSEFFQLHPDQCRGDEISIANNMFTLHGSRNVTIAGVASAGATHQIADANKWNNLSQLLGSEGASNELRIATGEIPLTSNQIFYLALQQIELETKVAGADELSKLFSKAEKRRKTFAELVVVETPDPFINAAAGALNIAADAIWDEQQQSFMHGAVAWRTRLLGWRGQYAGDALGWHERTAAHFTGYAKNQNTDPIPDTIPPADENSNLARNEAALHSNGDMMNRSHYDMNLVAVDAFFRHLLWTGDTNYARTMWPVIERHLAWERRLFRREFGEDKLPLYEAYAAIWASDDLNYNGGGTAHASACNYFANKMAARVAHILGENATPYEREADLILRGMQKYLWIPSEGNFAEFKDYLGLQLVHPNAGLWTFYHTLDSDVPTPSEAWQMSRWVDENISHIPIRGENVPDENLFVLPETSWMPYTWSLNNVVLAENMHTALGFWQANRTDRAFPLFKGALLDTMFLGLCPGNVGAMMNHDMARGEAQRDFADGIGVTSRALIEGLFGVKPDALVGELKIVPGFPSGWKFAKISHPNFNFEFRREDVSETYVIESKFSKPMKLVMEVPAFSDWVGGVYVNGSPAKFQLVKGIFGVPRLKIQSDAAQKWEVRVEWRGDHPTRQITPEVATIAKEKPPAVFDWNKKIPANTKFESVNLASFFNDSVTQIFKNDYRSPRSPFCSLATPKHGIGGWCEPNASFDVDDSGLRAIAAKNSDKIVLPDSIPLATPGEHDAKNIAFVSQWDNYPDKMSVPLSGKSSHAFLLMAGSTSAMQSRFDNGEVIVTYADGTITHLALNNPVNWWPIDQDYFIDNFAFYRPEPLPPRIDLKTGQIRVLNMNTFAGTGGKVSGGSATVLDLPLDSHKELKSLTIRALANEVVIGLMAVTLQR